MTTGGSTTMAKAEILRQFAIFSMPTGGIGGWLTANTDDAVFDRLGRIADEPLPAVQLNQLLVLSQQAPVEDGFFRYYWLEASKGHPYDLPPHRRSRGSPHGWVRTCDRFAFPISLSRSTMSSTGRVTSFRQAGAGSARSRTSARSLPA